MFLAMRGSLTRGCRQAHSPWMLLVVICAALVSILPSAGRAEPLAMPVSTVTVSLTDFGIRLSTGTVHAAE